MEEDEDFLKTPSQDDEHKVVVEMDEFSESSSESNSEKESASVRGDENEN